jgi:5-methylcytosine-specific restriction endonuclease McrA
VCGVGTHNEKFCSRRCRADAERKVKIVEQKCLWCFAAFTYNLQRANLYGRMQVFCSKACSLEDARMYGRASAMATPWAKYARQCATPQRERLSQEEKKKQISDQARLAGMARHRTAGVVVRCKECTIEFCPLYGVGAAKRYCSKWCAKRSQKKAEQKRHGFVGGNESRARFYGVRRERVSPMYVMKRDRWTCQLCGVKTPQKLRGTCSAQAPEIDHIIPMSRGGPHTHANVQCVCRSCNGNKGARPLGQLLLVG